MFSGAEKSTVPAGTSALIAIPVFVQGVLSIFGIIDPPSPEDLKNAIVIVLIGLGVSWGVWQVPNSGDYEDKGSE